MLVTLMAARAADFAILNLRVIEGEGSVYAIGSRAARGITIEVTDETGKPVPDVTISFRLPDDGPSGVFSTGARTELVTTRQDGRALVWGMRWNRTPGTVQVRITAVKDKVRAGLMSTQYLTDAPAVAKSQGRGGSHSKLLWIALAAAGAAGGGLALGFVRSPQQSPAAVAAVPLSIGTPSVIVGAP